MPDVKREYFGKQRPHRYHSGGPRQLIPYAALAAGHIGVDQCYRQQRKRQRKHSTDAEQAVQPLQQPAHQGMQRQQPGQPAQDWAQALHHHGNQHQALKQKGIQHSPQTVKHCFAGTGGQLLQPLLHRGHPTGSGNHRGDGGKGSHEGGGLIIQVGNHVHRH